MRFASREIEIARRMAIKELHGFMDDLSVIPVNRARRIDFAIYGTT